MTEHHQELREERRPLDTVDDDETDVRVAKTIEDVDAYDVKSEKNYLCLVCLLVRRIASASG